MYDKGTLSPTVQIKHSDISDGPPHSYSGIRGKRGKESIQNTDAPNNFPKTEPIILVRYGEANIAFWEVSAAHNPRHLQRSTNPD